MFQIFVNEIGSFNVVKGSELLGSVEELLGFRVDVVSRVYD